MWNCAWGSENEGKLPLECIASDLICDAKMNIFNGVGSFPDLSAYRCPVCTCSDENDFLIKCLNDSDENCPNATDIKACENPIYYWIWIVVGIVGLIILMI